MLVFLCRALVVVVSVVSLSAAADEATPSRQEVTARETVVLLHGLGRTSRSFKAMAEFLRESGYRTVQIDYPSTKQPIDALASHLSRALDECCPLDSVKPPLHFVTHSLGGILLRYHLLANPQRRVARVVMLAPPSGGSELVDTLRGNPLFRFVTGPAGQQLGTDERSVPSGLGPVNFELGVITGDRSFNPLYSWLIPGPDDGKVAVKSARTEGMQAFLVVPHTHTFIMRAQPVMLETLNFLRTGDFLQQQAR